MSSVRFELDIGGLRELMKSDAMQGQLKEAGNEIASSATSMATASGAEYNADVVVKDYVAIGRVHANTEAFRENLHNNVLLKALSSSGLSMSK